MDSLLLQPAVLHLSFKVTRWLRQGFIPFVHLLQWYWGVVRLLGIVHVSVTTLVFAGRPDSAGSSEISQVPIKELLHVHRVSGCARYPINSPLMFMELLSSVSLKNINTSISMLSQLNT